MCEPLTQVPSKLHVLEGIYSSRNHVILHRTLFHYEPQSNSHNGCCPCMETTLLAMETDTFKEKFHNERIQEEHISLGSVAARLHKVDSCWTFRCVAQCSTATAGNQGLPVALLLVLAASVSTGWDVDDLPLLLCFTLHSVTSPRRSHVSSRHIVLPRRFIVNSFGKCSPAHSL